MAAKYLTLVLTFAAAGCDLGGDGSGGGGHPYYDAAVNPHIDARVGMPDGPRPDAAPFTCRNKITTGLDTGHHNPGQVCQQGCHDHGMVLAGTLFTSASGTTPFTGASLTVVDATGDTFDMISSQNGNFWWGLPVTFPITVIASACPSVAPMTAQITSEAQGMCSTSACHGGTAGKLHLP